MRYLLADDHRQARSLIRAILHEDHCEFFEARTGVDACKAYAQHSPDWLIMDLDMPIINGISATRIISSFKPEAKIILTTFHDSEEIRVEALAAGAHACICKEDLINLPSLIDYPQSA